MPLPLWESPPHRNIAMFGKEKTRMTGLRKVKKFFEDIFSDLDTQYERDRQTDIDLYNSTYHNVRLACYVPLRR